ncbi:uncharacterized protein I303_106485 [Kwoniella dejecticola CBS 10117]|uniref:ABM domain-containing protein n=1 Tax=Kwoniella dejecticola CBS 10117 TaxID=1296121 RepID=A0A1A5ZUK0_9TREE|nr:uncharacterized protein I303_08257 [Kwoniella dejecticola CBS 10117]OBR81487.1 hypothetical protein I303_08257 [Kwoniella dejecticola CBS 10117]
MVHIVVVFVEAKPESVEAVKKRMTEAGKIYEKDPGTLEFSLKQDVTNPQKFVIVERYDQESSLNEIHRKNPIFAETVAWLRENVVKPNEPHHISA